MDNNRSSACESASDGDEEIEHEIATYRGDMGEIWRHTFCDESRVIQDHPILSIEAPLHPTANREKMTPVTFSNNPFTIVDPNNRRRRSIRGLSTSSVTADHYYRLIRS